MKGTVKFFNEDKKYGFITGEDGVEYFVHVSFLGEALVSKGDTVEFKPVKDDKNRWQAKEVRHA